ncbi:hypothetical protein I2F27_12755 [Acinetobacter sp. B5B]|uniref:hypothetical protein n=1 Tax=Acinetobacter baretiae TaxID=2605383 RepID=UPI0018C23EA6|nr:hypothetical protein [Acinetobacter baretiae]MBF7684160.1 hypothetical protein [Acinetobacter baretiae]
MSIVVETSPKKRISWASIFAGTLIVLAMSFLLSILGIALGFSMLDPLSNTDIGNGSGTTLGIWTGISLLLSLAVGSFFSGKIAGIHGSIHGFLVWCLALIFGLFISISTLTSTLNITGNIVGSVTSATGNIASALGQNTVQVFQNINLDDVLPDSSKLLDNSNKNIVSALEKSGIPELQPTYLNRQLDWAKDKIQSSIKDIAIHPQKSDEIVNDLTNALKTRLQSINNSISKDEIKTALTKNSNMTSKEADQAVENFLQERDVAIQKLNQAFEKAQMGVNDAKVKYQTLKQEAREKAAMATQAAAKAALWAFIGLFLGALVSIIGGRFGAKKSD